jgi:hypothetical protein
VAFALVHEPPDLLAAIDGVAIVTEATSAIVVAKPAKLFLIFPP